MTTPTLDLIRDEDVSVADLAAHFQQSEAWVAGCLDAVDGNQDWRLMFADADMVPTAAEQADYADGFTFGLAVLDGRDEEAEARAVAEGWDECYAMAAVEAAREAELVPVSGADEIPW